MNTNEMPVITVSGTGYERGAAYGEALCEPVKENIDRWMHMIADSRGISPEPYLKQFVQQTSYLATCERLTPCLLEEVRGMADAVGIDFELMFAQQLHDEEWIHARNKRLGWSLSDAGKCSNIGVNDIPNGPTVIGQNIDIGEWCDGSQTILHSKYDDDTEVAVVAYAGSLGVCGFNNKSVALCCATLMQLDFDTGGLPVSFVVRSILEKPTFEAARDFIYEVPHASGQNYMLGGVGKLANFECGAGAVTEFVRDETPKRVFHTNHVLMDGHQDLVNKFSPGASTAILSGAPTSEARFASLEGRIGDASRPSSIHGIKEALAAKDDPAAPVCRDGSSGMPGDPDDHIGFTFASLLFVLDTPPYIEMAAGPPSLSEYRHFDIFST